MALPACARCPVGRSRPLAARPRQRWESKGIVRFAAAPAASSVAAALLQRPGASGMPESKSGVRLPQCARR